MDRRKEDKVTPEEIKIAARDIEYAAVELDLSSPTSLYLFRHFVESKLLEAVGLEVPVLPSD